MEQHKDLLDKFAELEDPEAIARGKVFRPLLAVVEEAGGKAAVSNMDKNQINQIYQVATRFPENPALRAPFVQKYIVPGKLGKPQLDLSFQYFKKNARVQTIDWDEFEKFCGVGVVVTEDEINKTVEEVYKQEADNIAKKGWAAYGAVLSKVKKILPFGDGALIVNATNAKFVKELGPKENAPAPVKEKPAKPAKEPAASKSTLPESVEYRFPPPQDNIQKDPKLLEEHLKITGGRVVTRFPPEPNGYLHVGHAKSMNLNFGYAEAQGGWCYLRFDDTNPTAEKQEYIDNIQECVRWLGFTPYKITYASDNFEKLHQFAIQLIKKGKAYVCHQKKEDMQRDRKAGVDSPWRNRSVEENLKLFEDMRKGKFAEGEACLRVKGDMKHQNPNMRDFVAYRIKYYEHPHVGDKWCIYPSYDFTHCICDSLENITHSLCTLEFRIRRETYEWLNHELGIYCPPQIEFSRLNVSHCMTSKRKLKRMVEMGIVDGWDDPRMPTLMGFRRKGYTPEGIRDFCQRVGITEAEQHVPLDYLNECQRQHLDKLASRYFAVLHPLKVSIVNWTGEPIIKLKAQNHPTTNMGTRDMIMTSTIYIERDDFRTEDKVTKDYYRLSPGKVVGLRYFNDHNIKCVGVEKDKDGNVVEIKAELVPKEKVKVHIHWVANPAPGKTPHTAQVNLYKNLFDHEDPGSVDDWLSIINPNSKECIKEAYIEESLKDYASKPFSHFQFERLGFFNVDPTSTADNFIINRTLELKDSLAKLEQKTSNK